MAESDDIQERSSASIAAIIRAAIENNLIKDISQIGKYAREIRAALSGDTTVEVVPKEAQLEAFSTSSSAGPVARIDPIIPIKDSVTDDYIVCLECGQRFKSIKRHLGSSHGMTAERYIHKWQLPYDYPLTAPKYSEARSRLAKNLGLGRKPGGGYISSAVTQVGAVNATTEPPATPEAPSQQKTPQRGRSRRKAAAN